MLVVLVIGAAKYLQEIENTLNANCVGIGIFIDSLKGVPLIIAELCTNILENLRY